MRSLLGILSAYTITFFMYPREKAQCLHGKVVTAFTRKSLMLLRVISKEEGEGSGGGV